MLEVNRRSPATPRPKPAFAAGEVGVTIAEAAARTGVSAYTLRYYERAGLVITDIDRTEGGRRRYRKVDLDWILVCTKLRATGMPIKTIRRYAQLVAEGHGNEEERLALMEAHRADVATRIADLEEHLKLIDHKIDVYRDRLAAGDADQLWAPGVPPAVARPAEPDGIGACAPTADSAPVTRRRPRPPGSSPRRARRA